MLVMIKGAGDIASGIAMRLWRAGINVVMTDLPRPSSIRRTVCFSEAVYRGETTVEEVRARRAENAADALRLLEESILPVIVDPKADLILITPITSHTLNARSIVIAGSDEVGVELAARKQDADEQVVVSFDGDHYTTLSVGDRIAIHRAKQGCNICRLSNVSFLEILRKKMQRYN